MSQETPGYDSTDSGSINLDKVTLDVGGRKFVTLATTLSESQFLGSLVSGRWQHNRQEDGSYFIDADPDLFKEILNYLRRQWMPLFWDREKGHDLARYKTLLQEAEYYGIPKLAEWLKKQKYLDAVTNSTEFHKCLILADDSSYPNVSTSRLPSSKSMTQRMVEVKFVEKNIYSCLDRHHYSVDCCDIDCFKLRAECDMPQKKSYHWQAVAVDNIVVLNTGCVSSGIIECNMYVPRYLLGNAEHLLCTCDCIAVWQISIKAR